MRFLDPQPAPTEIRIPTNAVHSFGFVCITDARFLSPALLATLNPSEKVSAR